MLFVDARMVSATGIGRHITSHLSVIASSGLRIIAGVKTQEQRSIVLQSAPNAEIIRFPSDIYTLREQLRGSWLTRSLQSRVSAYWYPHYNMPWWAPENAVVTVHDLIQIKFAHLGWNRLRVEAAKRVLRRTALRAKKIVCVSQRTANDLCEFEPSVEGKVTVIPNGISDFWRPSTVAEQADFRRQKELSVYILATGNKKPHKNFRMLLHVIDALAKDIPEIKLVVIGKRERSWLGMIADWESNGGDRARLVDLENIPDEELRLYYSCADLFLMPSIYEGFGLPPLEAMACGTPVLCSTGGALPQTVGDAAFTVDPFDSSAWIDAAYSLLFNEAQRKSLVMKGFEHAKTFATTEHSNQFVKIIRELMVWD